MLPLLKRSALSGQGARLVNVSSFAGIFPGSMMMSAYAASKHAVQVRIIIIIIIVGVVMVMVVAVVVIIINIIVLVMVFVIIIVVVVVVAGHCPHQACLACPGLLRFRRR
jgi:hypothetical protein